MSRYPAFVDGEPGAYGVAFPALPGIVAMGETVDDALLNAEEALRDYVRETERDGVRVVEPSPIERVSPREGTTLVGIFPHSPLRAHGPRQPDGELGPAIHLHGADVEPLGGPVHGATPPEAADPS